MGVNYYPATTSFYLHRDMDISAVIGLVTLERVNNDLIVTIKLNEGVGYLESSYLYVGTLDGLKNTKIDLSTGCPDYYSWLITYPYPASQVHTFIVPL
jgi:hypothetical protein